MGIIYFIPLTRARELSKMVLSSQFSEALFRKVNAA